MCEFESLVEEKKNSKLYKHVADKGMVFFFSFKINLSFVLSTHICDDELDIPTRLLYIVPTTNAMQALRMELIHRHL